jgi:FAD/FMN-containing dehydrogenase
MTTRKAESWEQDMNSDRRTVLVGGLVTAAVGIRPAGGQTGSAHMHGNGSRPVFGGTLRLDDGSRTEAADDFGHIASRRPEGVLSPASDEDVAKAIRWAREHGRKVAARGQGHSVFGRAQAEGGMVIDMRQLRTVRAIGDDRIIVDAGATWKEVLAATLPHGRTPPVLTDYLDLSVGGTLVVGGVGGTTASYGMQSDNVIERRSLRARARR